MTQHTLAPVDTTAGHAARQPARRQSRRRHLDDRRAAGGGGGADVTDAIPSVLVAGQWQAAASHG